MSEGNHNPSLVDPEAEALRQRLQGLTIKGKAAADKIGDLDGARTFLSLFHKYGSRYTGAAEFRETLMPLVKQKMANAITDKEAATWAKVGLEAMKQDDRQVENLMDLMGISRTEQPSVNVQINNTSVDKVLNIIDGVRGAHARDENSQKALNDAAREILFGGIGRPQEIETDRVGTPVGAQESSGGRKVLNPAPSGDVERSDGPVGGQEKPSDHH